MEEGQLSPITSSATTQGSSPPRPGDRSPAATGPRTMTVPFSVPVLRQSLDQAPAMALRRWMIQAPVPRSRAKTATIPHWDSVGIEVATT